MICRRIIVKIDEHDESKRTWQFLCTCILRGCESTRQRVVFDGSRQIKILKYAKFDNRAKSHPILVLTTSLETININFVRKFVHRTVIVFVQLFLNFNNTINAWLKNS